MRETCLTCGSLPMSEDIVDNILVWFCSCCGHTLPITQQKKEVLIKYYECKLLLLKNSNYVEG